jgi:hypothetical protein
MLDQFDATRIPRCRPGPSQTWLRRFNSAFVSRFGLQTLTVKSRLLPGENTVRIRGSPPFPPTWLEQ